MKRKTLYTIIALILLAVAATACKRTSNSQTPGAGNQRGQCPKLDGSYINVDKSTIKQGEAVYVYWKIPRAYAKNVKIEGLYREQASDISSAADIEEDYFQGKLPAKPERSTKLVLKAIGPEGCQPLELPASVAVFNEAGEELK